jgi:hypothetical protein
MVADFRAVHILWGGDEFGGKRDHYILPLKKECNEGKALLAQAPVPLLYLQEFDPSGLEQTYRDETTGAEIPVFAVFDLEGSHQVAYEIILWAWLVPTRRV